MIRFRLNFMYRSKNNILKEIVFIVKSINDYKYMQKYLFSVSKPHIKFTIIQNNYMPIHNNNRIRQIYDRIRQNNDTKNK